MTVKYCTVEKIEKYIRNSTDFTFDHERLARMVNYFIEGALTTLSNPICEDYLDLIHTNSPGCRCGLCYEYQLVDNEDGTVYYSGETLGDLLNAVKGEKI